MYKFSPGGNLTLVAGIGTAGYSGDGGPATSAELNNPSGVAVDSNGNVYIADTDNNRIRMVAASTGSGYTAGDIYTVAGNGTAGFLGASGSATSAELNYPAGVAVDSSGNLYIADTDNDVIRKVTVSTGDISTVAGTAGAAGYSGDKGSATSAKLDKPSGVAVDSLGNIYIADTYNSVIRKVAASTGDISTVAGGGTGCTSTTCAATSASAS